MNLIKRGLKYIKHKYEIAFLKTDKNIFSFFFNLRSLLINSPARLKWNNNIFELKDKLLPNKIFLIRHQKVCCYSYEKGLGHIAEILHNEYFLSDIRFSEGDTFIDCGANIGGVKLKFDILNLKINYIGFEPSPIEFECLKRNVYPSKVHNIGLWNQEETLNFYISSQGADSSIIEPKFFDKVISIESKRLENYIHSNIKCLKLEAEGAEKEILEGIGSKIKYIEYITADLGFERGISQESTLVSVTNYLLNKGFEMLKISHSRICVLYKNQNYAKFQS